MPRDVATVSPHAHSERWPPAQRVLFRFGCVYFVLYALVTQIAGGLLLTPVASLPAFGTVWPVRDLTLWLAEHVFGATPPLVNVGNSGDTVFHWTQTAWLLTLAIAAVLASLPPTIRAVRIDPASALRNE